MSKLLLTLTLVLAISSTPIMVKAAEIEGAEVLKFGIFKSEVVRSEAAAGAAAGSKGIVRNAVLVTQTTRIPARKGTQFGFQYAVKGSPVDAKIKVTNKYLHPLVQNPQTKKSFTSQTTRATQKIGKAVFVGYTFDHDWELVPGEWTIQVYSRGKKLAEKSFQVVK